MPSWTQKDERHSHEERSVQELRNLAVARNIQGRSRMKKAELIKALRSC